MKKKKIIINFALIFILLLAAIFTYICYGTIKNTAINSIDEKTIQEYVISKSSYYNYVLDLMLSEKNGEDADINQYFSIEGEETTETITDISYFSNNIQYYQNTISSETDIMYSAIDTQTGALISTGDMNLLNIHDDPYISNQIQYFIELEYDENGEGGVIFTSYMDNYNIEDYAINYDGYNSVYQYYALGDTISDELLGTLTFTGPKNIHIVYAISNNIVDNGDLMQYALTNEDYFRFSFPYIFIITLAMMFITFIIPLNYLNENNILSYISHIKFGILIALWCLLLFILVNIGGRVIVLCTLNHEIDTIYTYFSISQLSDYLTPIINIIFWMCFYLLFVVLIYMIKYLFHKGIKRYVKENTLISWFIIQFKKLIQYVLSFDLDNNMNIVMIKILLINLLVLIICSLFGIFGILLAIIYTAVIFYVLRQKTIAIQKDYSILLEATKQLSLGSFDIDMNDDLGIFNPLKEEYGHIKDGFKIAVDNEVKSQKMKTELISNVSHDLKTPLTAIITYIDLLKNNNEYKQEYINILERNALRLKHLIDDLFDVSKANSGDIQLDLMDIELVSIIKEAQLECQDYLNEKELLIKYQIPDDKVILHLDSLKTFRIFENLFMNISKYTLPHTRVYIEVIDNDEYVQIIMKNISEAEMHFNGDEITERFIQGDKSRNQEGSGLGLAIVKSFTEIQNGSFHIELDGDLFKSIIIFNK